MNNNINKAADIYHSDHLKLLPGNKSLHVIYCQIHLQAQLCRTVPEKMNSIILRLLKHNYDHILTKPY